MTRNRDIQFCCYVKSSNSIFHIYFHLHIEKLTDTESANSEATKEICEYGDDEEDEEDLPVAERTGLRKFCIDQGYVTILIFVLALLLCNSFYFLFCYSFPDF